MKSGNAEVTAEKKQTQDYNQNFVTQAEKSQHHNKLTDVKNTSGDKKNFNNTSLQMRVEETWRRLRKWNISQRIFILSDRTRLPSEQQRRQKQTSADGGKQHEAPEHEEDKPSSSGRGRKATGVLSLRWAGYCPILVHNGTWGTNCTSPLNIMNGARWRQSEWRENEQTFFAFLKPDTDLRIDKTSYLVLVSRPLPPSYLMHFK